jgi:hypothetical protein
METKNNTFMATDNGSQESQKPRIVLLYRASSKQQTDAQNDIPLQRNILKPWAEQQGYAFHCELVEGGVSGSRFMRKTGTPS